MMERSLRMSVTTHMREAVVEVIATDDSMPRLVLQITPDGQPTVFVVLTPTEASVVARALEALR